MTERSIAEKKKLYYDLLGQMGNALCDFNMLAPNDRILVAVSGGKDSMTLLRLLLDRKKMTPFPYEVTAIHVQAILEEGRRTDIESLKEILKKWEVPFEIIPLEVRLRIGLEKDKQNCFWCSWNRRKIFFEAAKRLKCTKLALGHHRDDLIETTLLNLFYQGRFATMLPIQPYFKGEFHMIRPLCYIEEKDILQFVADQDLACQVCDCPLTVTSQRTQVENLLNSLSKENEAVRSNIFAAAMRFLKDPSSQNSGERSFNGLDT
jgi:tRNA(Ile)-lysidine synthetase-like protein